MAFAYTRTKGGNPGGFKMACGTFTNGDNDSGGDIVTSIKYIQFACCIVNSHVGATLAKTTWSGGTLTIGVPDGVDGYWFAIGN